MTDSPEILARVAELTTAQVIETLLVVPPAERGRWRWRCDQPTLDALRRLPPPNPEAGPILVPPPPGYERVRRPDESGWLLLGRPLELTDAADGLELAEIPPEPEPATVTGWPPPAAGPWQPPGFP